MRKRLTVTMVVGGLALMVVSYFWLAPPWGSATVENANPRLDFAGLLFIIGVLVAFSAALVYELLPDRKPEKGKASSPPGE